MGNDRELSLVPPPFVWDARSRKRLGELLLEGLSWADAIERLSIEFGPLTNKEGVCEILDGGGTLPFILKNVPDVTRGQASADERGVEETFSRPLHEQTETGWAKKRSALTKLAAYEVYDEEVDRWWEKFLQALRGETSNTIPSIALLRIKLWAGNDPSRASSDALVSGACHPSHGPFGKAEGARDEQDDRSGDGSDHTRGIAIADPAGQPAARRALLAGYREGHRPYRRIRPRRNSLGVRGDRERHPEGTKEIRRQKKYNARRSREICRAICF